MRIGIDCRTILNPGVGEQAGVGHYTHYLVKNLLEIDSDNTYVLFFDDRFKQFDAFKKSNVEIRVFPFYQYKKYLPVAYSQFLITAFLEREKLDVYHSPANVLPLTYSKPSVVTVHDLAIYKYPQFFPGQYISKQISTRGLVPKSLAKAEKIIAVSKNTKSDIIEEFAIPEEKIEVVYEGVVNPSKTAKSSSLAEIRSKFGIEGKYILFLSTLEPRKNLVSLIKAFRDLKLVYDSPAKDYQLIIAGAKGWKEQPIFDAIAAANASINGNPIRRSGADRRSGFDTRSENKKIKEGERRKNLERRKDQPIKYIGYVSHADKLALISNATTFVFPSWYEGFGLPILEAMSLGTPVITSNTSSMPEIVGRKAGILIDPNKESEIAEAISNIITDQGLRESLCLEGIARAKEFSWLECARKTLEVYQSASKSKIK